jgi:hypothetical protein
MLVEGIQPPLWAGRRDKPGDDTGSLFGTIEIGFRLTLLPASLHFADLILE